MKYASAAGFRMALEQRLHNLTRVADLPLARLRKSVVFDRLLARLSASAPDRWVLKGALALDFRFESSGRSTKDIDLVRRDNEEAATEDLIAAQATELDDHFVFTIEKVEKREEWQEGAALRYRARAELAGKLFDEVIIDVGFTDPLKWEPERLTGPDLLGFADIEPAEVHALPLEQQVAEKLHAYTRVYGSGHPSSRAKDLIDLVLIKSYATLDASRLREATVETFRSRALQPLPPSVPVPPPDWETAYRKLATEVGIDPTLSAGLVEARGLLDPILTDEAIGHWDPAHQHWAGESSSQDSYR
jgi:Nucleotidyl transferase AbiEii toxin, Type IV TA system